MSGYLEHITTINERWDTIAYRYYGEANRTSVLIKANRDLFLPTLAAVPTILPYGLTIRVPLIDAASVDPDALPPWKR